jgi:hypothetical protein
VKEDLGNVQQDVARLKEEMIITKRMTGGREFASSMKKGKKGFDVPDGIIAHLTKTFGGNVHGRKVVLVTAGSFEKTTTKNDYRESHEHVPPTPNNWVCYDFKKRSIVPIYYTIRTNGDDPGASHLKSWLVETSAEGESWREVAREEDNKQFNGSKFIGTFEVTCGGAYRFIRLVNIGRNHEGHDQLLISGWEIFAVLRE